MSNYKDRGPRWCGKIIRVSRIGRKRRVESWMQSRAKGLWRGKEKKEDVSAPRGLERGSEGGDEEETDDRRKRSMGSRDDGLRTKGSGRGLVPRMGVERSPKTKIGCLLTFGGEFAERQEPDSEALRCRSRLLSVVGS